MKDHRPDPDHLLKVVSKELKQDGRGRLVSGNCGCFGGIPRARPGWWICGQRKRVAHNPTAANIGRSGDIIRHPGRHLYASSQLISGSVRKRNNLRQVVSKERCAVSD